jgi:hypothetical protein
VVELPPETPFTCHVTVVLVVVVPFVRFTVATNWLVVLTGTVTATGVMAMEVIVPLPVPLPPPQAERERREGTAIIRAQISRAFLSIR